MFEYYSIKINFTTDFETACYNGIKVHSVAYFSPNLKSKQCLCDLTLSHERYRDKNIKDKKIKACALCICLSSLLRGELVPHLQEIFPPINLKPFTY